MVQYNGLTQREGGESVLEQIERTDYHYQGTLLSLSHYNSKHGSTVFTVVVLHYMSITCTAGRHV